MCSKYGVGWAVDFGFVAIRGMVPERAVFCGRRRNGALRTKRRFCARLGWREEAGRLTKHVAVPVLGAERVLHARCALMSSWQERHPEPVARAALAPVCHRTR